MSPAGGLGGSNINGVIETETIFQERGTTLAAYDRLPPLLRELYDAAPVPYDPVEWLAVYEIFGLEAARAMIYSVIREQFPRWSPLTRRKQRATSIG